MESNLKSKHGHSKGPPKDCPSASTTTKALAPTDRPPPGFQNPFTQTSLAPLSTLQGNKPPGLSLGSLASEHLKTQPSSGLENLVPGTLGSLSLQQNAEEGKKETVGKLRIQVDNLCQFLPQVIYLEFIN